MSEIVEFVHHGAAQITPKILRGVHKKLPFLKMEFTQIDAPKYPHLVEQLEFLADVVEDFAEGAEDNLPYLAVTSAALDRKSTRLNSSHDQISYAVFCLKKKKKQHHRYPCR